VVRTVAVRRADTSLARPGTASNEEGDAMTRPTARRLLTLTVMAGLFATLDARAEAQRLGRLPPPRAGAYFYRDANFRGDYFCVRSGDAIDTLPNDLNDQISSVRMPGGDVEVTVFQNRGFKRKSRCP